MDNETIGTIALFVMVSLPLLLAALVAWFGRDRHAP